MNCGLGAGTGDGVTGGRGRARLGCTECHSVRRMPSRPTDPTGGSGLAPGDGFGGGVLTLHGVCYATGELGAGVGDGGAEGFRAVFRLGFTAIALSTEYHADFDAYTISLEGGGDDESDDEHDESDGDPDSLFHAGYLQAKKFPMRRNFS